MTDVHDRATAQWVSLWFETKPVSVNAIWRSYARGNRVATIKSQVYRDFIRDAGAELEAQKPCCVPGYYGISITLAKSCKADVDNVAKCYLDLLALHGVTGNDRLCQRLSVKRSTDDKTNIQVISTKKVG